MYNVQRYALAAKDMDVEMLPSIQFARCVKQRSGGQLGLGDNPQAVDALTHCSRPTTQADGESLFEIL